MKSLILLWREVAHELATWCHTSTIQDYKTVLKRSAHEGILPFMAITLPSFGKDLERALEQGKVDDSMFLSFKKHGRLPAFLQGFSHRVFDRETGVLLDDPCVDSIFAIRQLTLMFAKILEPCSDARFRDAMHGYIKCEKEVQSSDRRLKSTSLNEEFFMTFQKIFGPALSVLDEDIFYDKLVPKHGPGATADKLRGNAKYDQREWTQRLESVFPFLENCLPSWSDYQILDHVTFLEPGAERPVRVIAVPKTQKTPRIIAIEPTCMQYMQQAIMERLVQLLEDRSYRFEGMIGFTEQEPNQLLAYEGSLFGDLATLDLSEASDRVSWQLVRGCLARYPSLLAAVDATRSRRADVDGFGIVPLSKFASMGSALTFPLEAMVFLTCVILAVKREHSTSSSVAEILDELGGVVRVYGDDIIVPVRYVESVVRHLCLFGFKVNSSKSFWNGKFRESCGKEYFSGYDVSIARVRRELPAQRTDVQEVISAVSLRNQFYKLGLWRTAGYLDNILIKMIRYFPVVEETSPLLGRHSFLPGYQVDRMSDTLHAPLVMGYVVKANAPDSKISGIGALQKFFLKRGLEPFADERHLERQGRPTRVYIKKRWAQPF